MKEVTIKARNGTNCIVYGVLNTPSRKKDKVITQVKQKSFTEQILSSGPIVRKRKY